MAQADKARLTHIWTMVEGMPMHARFSREAAPPTAPTIVLVHGLSVSSGYMVPTAVRLSPSYPVLLPDLPGFGKSAKPRRILTVPELADALAAWMQALELPPAVLLGNSLGCQIIAHFALRHPARVTHAVLVGPTMDPKARSLRKAALRLALDLPREPLSFLPVLTREYLAAGPWRTLRTLQDAFADPLEALLPRITVPTLIVRGARDPIVGQIWCETIQRLLPQGQLVVVSGAAHAVNFNAPDALVRAVQSFLLESKQQARRDPSRV